VCSRPRYRSLNPGTHLGVRQLDRKHERHGERGARSERRDLAQRCRDRVLGQVHADTGGRHDRWPAGVEVRRCQPLPPRVACLEVDWHEPQERRDAEAEVDEALALPLLRAGLIDLEHEQTGGKFRPTLGEGVQGRSEDDVLPDAAGSLFRDEIFDKAGAGHDGGAEGPRERAHVRTAAPSIVWSYQHQADFVFEHVRGRIDFYVQRPPQGDPYRRVVWRRHLLIMHDVLSWFSAVVGLTSAFSRRRRRSAATRCYAVFEWESHKYVPILLGSDRTCAICPLMLGDVSQRRL